MWSQMARVSLIPTLVAMRALYERPRDMARFRAYLDLLRSGTDDVGVPVVAFNPMAKPHVAARIDELIAMDAERVAAEACREAQTRLPPDAGEWRVALQVPDDVAGGWTDRYLTDAQHRFEGAGEVKRGFATVLLWASEAPDAAQIRQRTLAAIARRVRQRDHGDPRTLREMTSQEAAASAFAGGSPAEPLRDEERATIERHLDATLYATRFACVYGDEAAQRAGYPALGLSPFAGLRYAASLTSSPRGR